MSFTWHVLGDVITALPDTTHYCPLTMPTQDIMLRAVRTFIVLYNDPTLSELLMNIYSDLNGVPGQLLYQSTTSQTRDSIMDADSNSCANEIWFEFEQLPLLKKACRYHFGLEGTYTFASDSYIAWKKAWPNPAYENGLDETDGRLLWSFPYDMGLIGAKL